ncbi:MAG: DUF1259 domain-containing protein [Gemmatimonadota bacterium]|nr:DUF1259 domain-containing protein [Gemmatimonadota bacterium]
MQAFLSSPRRIVPGLLVLLGAWSATACGPSNDAPSEARADAGKTAAAAPPASARADSTKWAAVDEALGRQGESLPGGVHKFTMPRTDLPVVSGGLRIKPALALGSWLAFMPKGAGAVAMGDLVLTEREYTGVIARLQQGGVGQTAVHKHLPEHSPAVWWTHIHAEGDPVEIARTVKAALALTGTPPEEGSGAATRELALDTAAIRRTLGHGGKVNGGVYQVSIPRAEIIRAGGIELPASMGTATALNFQPTGRGKAAINGDFVMTAAEVQPVIAALKANAIQVVALHNHMLDEEPRLFFMHFWANDDPVMLARGLRAALDQTNSTLP